MGETTGIVNADIQPIGGNTETDGHRWQYVNPGDLGTGTGTAAGGSDSGTGTRRGRKPGSKNSSAAKEGAPASLRGLDITEILLSAHSMLAIALRTPAIALEKEEAEKLQDAIKRVWKHYPLNVSQKQVDIAFAVTVCGEIYGTRIAAAMLAKSIKPEAENSPSADLTGVHFIQPRQNA